MQKVLGLGNALVDILIRLKDDKLLAEFSLPKGSMQLTGPDTAHEIMDRVQGLKISISSGGSAANTINGLARLGIPTGYIGAIGKDKYGEYFREGLEKYDTTTYFNYRDTGTGIATGLITPDSERTFATYLGAALELDASMIKEEQFKGYAYLHFEGYLVPNHDLVEKALEMAHKNGLLTSIDLASYNIVEENLEFLRELIKDHVDIVFANEDEAKALTGKEPEEALEEIAGMCDIAVVKIGKKGSLIKQGKKSFRVGVIDAQSLDTTGAGDLYAAGFFYGLINQFPLDECGRIASVLSGKVIEVIGSKMDDRHWEEIRELIRS
jgi:sugar/nucleoside kinase (ribokinase family)